jgi:cyclic beta-1,2-glucan synthetase
MGGAQCNAENFTHGNGPTMSTSSIEPAAPAPPVSPPVAYFADDQPLRGELFGLEHLEAHARAIARTARLAPPDRPGDPLLRRFFRIGRDLERAYQQISTVSRRGEPVTSDAEWLLDNYHIVAETLREVRHDLPRGYYRELPKLAEGPFAGLPRVYALAIELIAHTDSSLDETNVVRFVQAYQTVTPLTIGELWAVPIMLRLGLLENLRCLSLQMLGAWADRREAEAWKKHLIPPEGAAVCPPGEPKCKWSDPFVVHLLQQLRDHGTGAYPGIEWLETHLAGRSLNSTEVLRREHQRQAANQVSVGNCVTSLRLLSALDWTVFFERTSLVEKVLSTDPAGVYARQDFPTKDRYRREVEVLARGSGRDELEVARLVVTLAGGNARIEDRRWRMEENPPGTSETEPISPSQAGRGENEPTSPRASNHVGYYLIGPGRIRLEQEIHYRPRLNHWLRGLLLNHAKWFYFGSLALVTALIIAGILVLVGSAATPGLAVLVVGATLLPASELAVGLINYLVTLMLPPRVLPKMDFKDGISADCTTFVVMPTMLLGPESGPALASRLEIHYLSNPDPQLRFALLTDFADAPIEQTPNDEALLKSARDAIQALNNRYCPGGPPRFFLLHRHRQWNPVQGCWMGWERKRGKLAEFNRLLRGARDTSFIVDERELSALPRARFVITLDADTRLPREAAVRLVATLAHPLNRPRFDPAAGRVVEGYGILQPRVSLGLAAAGRSLFAGIFTGSAGIDPYTTAVSDVYQDLFGLGTFTGKGIYDVDAFEAAAGHVFPDNRILSHDLIEGNYARCGLVTDVELLDDFPARYHAYARREHRWVRGDWQILPWLFRRVPAPEGGKRPNPLPAVERWKIFDNLRRSLVPPGLVVLLVLGWTVLPEPAWAWTVFALLVPALPLLLLLGGGLVNLLLHGSWRLQWRAIRGSLAATGGQALLGIVFLAEQARLMLDAIGRTLIRLFVTHRNLLEWETAASTERRLGTHFIHFGRSMGATSLLALLLAGLVEWLRPDALSAAGPVLLAWVLSPLVAFWVSLPRARPEPPLTVADRAYLRRVARKTWDFFETFVTDEDNGLPPDNFQEDPKSQVAHRTSPTNVGLYLLSTLSAHDLGYLSLPALLDRLEKTFETLERLERFHGHFFNWYDTHALKSLQPPYVSTVDSGNLLACLVTLKQGLRQKAEEPIPPPSSRDGLEDTLALIEEALRNLRPPADQEPTAAYHSLDATLQDVRGAFQETLVDLAQWGAFLTRLHEDAQRLNEGCQALARDLEEFPEQLQRWVGRFASLVKQRREELAEIAPWLTKTPAELDGAKTPGHRLTEIGSVAEWQERAEALAGEETGNGAAGPNAEPGKKAVLAPFLKESKAAEWQARLQALADRAAALAGAMDFRLLYNAQRHLFSIGFNLAHGRLDNSYYDLLASEACLTSFLALARGDAPRRHWFQLGRPLTRAAGGITLLSWGGTMFEYLMPRLFLRPLPGTLLTEAWRTAVDRHIEYGRQERVPWGISESAFAALDAALDYQYQSFGVPGLGLKRGLGKDLVIAPYATALALAVHPRAAVANLHALAEQGGEGLYGFYEALDFTRDRTRNQRGPAVVRSYMAHHQGMTLTALANCLLDDPLPGRFRAEPAVRATDMLLQERVPLTAPFVQPHGDEAAPPPLVRDSLPPVSRRLTTAQTPHPRVHLLSNRQYSVMLTNAGAGYSTCRDLDVTRWHEDRTRDCWGQFCYVRDLRTGLVWSAGYQPLCRPADEFEVIYSTDKAEFRRTDAGIETHWEIAVSPENLAEVRRVTLTNHNNRPHDLELTSYAEVVLAPHRADLAHPAFAKLFLETEFVPSEEALLCRRRPRSEDQKPIWAVHVIAFEGKPFGTVQYETDRARFLGRGRTPANPAALEPGTTLSGTTGPVLDPVFSLRRRVRVAPGASVSVAFTTAVADTREEALALADQYHDFHGVGRAFELAWAHSQVELRHLRLSAEEAHLYQRLAGHVVFAGAALRAAGAAAANHLGQPGLWRHGISGDKPIVLVRVAESDEIPLVRQLVLAHTYWRLKGLETDLVILNEHPASYLEELHQELLNLVRGSADHTLMDKPGGIFVRQAAKMAEEDRVLLQAAARVVLAGNRGSLFAQVDRLESGGSLPAPLVPSERKRVEERSAESLRPATQKLLFPNGLGGFTPDGREYVITLSPVVPPAEKPAAKQRSAPHASRSTLHALPPAPWINVVANPSCGFLISETGSGYTWAGNSQANRLTPWRNDPVSDSPSEIVYLRDETTGEFWSPTPLPLGPGVPIEVRHGQGYSAFRLTSHGLEQELQLYVPAKDPVKIVRLKVRNLGNKTRRLSATFYAEWVLGSFRDQAPMHVVTSLDPETGALLARSAFAGDFAGRVAFADAVPTPASFTADRTEFLGRNGSFTAPAALGRVGLAGSVGPTLDPCAALMTKFEVKPGEKKEVVFLLGQGDHVEDGQRMLRAYRKPGKVDQALQEVKALWDRVLGAVQVRTPDPALDLMLNRWLLYQDLSCRVWGRSAFYQSGGAFGFRDQLQDVMALVYGAPEEARAQILRGASRQFLEGDVQHWWHPPAGRGVRTRFSDDFLWLPFVVCHYVAVTGDATVLDEPVSWLRGPELKPEQEEDYGLPDVTEEKAPVYEHCIRAIENGQRFGTHGLPLMGTGDWNDGMNRVGAGGKGESVWDAWFQLAIFRQFAELAETRGDGERARWCREQGERLRKAVEENAWDGHWYRRAYFDDGTPLGSEQNDECQIDSIAQSWAVLSAVADPDRARQAMEAVEKRLVKDQEKLILLFTPPFDKGQLPPGYIKGYLPGIRENGGQYTHAATWVVLATALLGKGTRARELHDLLNPIHHADSPEGVTRYKVEPYVVAADVYSQPPHVGRGGWTWYTGSASWLYRVALEGMLGFHLRGDKLHLDPVIDARWSGFEITFQRNRTTYHVLVENPQGVERGVQSVTVDGQESSTNEISLKDDGGRHEIRVALG